MYLSLFATFNLHVFAVCSLQHCPKYKSDNRFTCFFVVSYEEYDIEGVVVVDNFLNFQEGEGGGGGLPHPHLNVKSKGGGGFLYEIPSVVGLWIFSGNTQHHKKLLKHNKCFSFNLEKKLVF